MAKSGLAKGANKGHITETRERAARPSQSKGVSLTKQSVERVKKDRVAGNGRGRRPFVAIIDDVVCYKLALMRLGLTIYGHSDHVYDHSSELHRSQPKHNLILVSLHQL
jgi:hypothetical protein